MLILQYPFQKLVFLEKRTHNRLLWDQDNKCNVILKSISYLIQSLFYFTKMHTEGRRQQRSMLCYDSECSFFPFLFSLTVVGY